MNPTIGHGLREGRRGPPPVIGAPTNGGAVVVVAPVPATVVVVLDGDDLRDVEPGVVVGFVVGFVGAVVVGVVVPDRTVVVVAPLPVEVVVVGVTAVVEVVGDAMLQVGDVMVLSSRVTAPFRASARP
jgi:hypothetical protein